MIFSPVLVDGFVMVSVDVVSFGVLDMVMGAGVFVSVDVFSVVGVVSVVV